LLGLEEKDILFFDSDGPGTDIGERMKNHRLEDDRPEPGELQIGEDIWLQIFSKSKQVNRWNRGIVLGRSDDYNGKVESELVPGQALTFAARHYIVWDADKSNITSRTRAHLRKGLTRREKAEMLSLLDKIGPDTVITEIRDVTSPTAPDETALEEVFYEAVPSIVVEDLLKWTRSLVEEGDLSNDTADPERIWVPETPRGEQPQHASTPIVEEAEEEDRVPDVSDMAEPEEVVAELIENNVETPARAHVPSAGRRLVVQEQVMEQRLTRSKNVPSEDLICLDNGETAVTQPSRYARNVQLAAPSDEIGDRLEGNGNTKTTPADEVVSGSGAEHESSAKTPRFGGHIKKAGRKTRQKGSRGQVGSV
jgi:hypothetical protein